MNTRMQKTEFRIQKGRVTMQENPAVPRRFGKLKPESIEFELPAAHFCILSPEFCIPKNKT